MPIVRFAARVAATASAALLVTAPVLAQQPADRYDYTRTSSFEYNSTTGLLTSETVEPDNIASCVKTTYGLDAYGNRNTVTVANCSGTVPARAQFTTRTTTAEHAPGTPQSVTINGVAVAVPQGAFPIAVTNALNHSETKTYDPRTGQVLSLTGPNGITTTWEYDNLGRKTRELRHDTTRTVWFYCILGSSGLDTTSNTPGCPTPATGEAPADAVMFVHSEARTQSDVKISAFTRVYTDRLGRTIRTATEAFDGASQPSAPGGVIVQDSVYNDHGAKTLETQPYFRATGSSTTAGSNDVGLSRTDYDVLGRPTAVYVTDLEGSQSGVAFGAFGNRVAARTQISYNGLVTTTTNDKNQTQTQEKTPSGKGARVTNALGAQIVHQYDAFDNLVATKDALGNQTALQYDIRGRKTQLTDPDTGIWQYDYNALGELVWQQSPNQRAASPQQQTTTAYDVLGRMISRTEPEYVTTWTYDKYADNSACNKGIGKLCEVSTTNGANRKYVYDNLGRSLNSRTNITSGPNFATAVSYDSATGRIASQTYPTGLRVNYNYTSRGFLETLTLAVSVTVNPLPATPGGTPGSSASLPAGTVLWRAQHVNAWGKIDRHALSNGVIGGAAFEAYTGRTAALSAAVGGGTAILGHTYAWDSLGNLRSRADANGDGSSGAVTENFFYDAVNRLERYDVMSSALPGLERRVTLKYNAIGSMLYKSDVGAYTYGASGLSSVRPHALASISGAAATTFSYDANGNMTSANGGKYRTVSYTSFNLPDSQNGIGGPSGSPRTVWTYDENHARIKEVRTIASGVMAGTRTTYYLHPDNAGGLGFEREINTPTTPSAENPAVDSNRHYLSVGGVTIGVMVSTDPLPTLSGTATAPPVISSITVVKVEYWHKDHLGSTAATTDHAGAVTGRYAYDPFGKRRYANGVYDVNGVLVIDYIAAVNHGSDRGFTGHEHLDELGLIHMNGRIYDPTLGIFLQADPFIQDPFNLQSYNRYVYCMSGPVSCTDPTGYFSFSKLIKAIRHFLRHPSLNSLHKLAHAKPSFQDADELIRKYPVIGQVATVAVTAVMTVVCGPCSIPIAGAMTAASAYAQGADTSEYWRAGLTATATAAAFYAAGAATEGNYYAKVVVHGAIGCASAYAGGGQCGTGAFSAGLSAAFAPTVHGQHVAVGVTVSAIVGGTASVIGGGKFGNGAVTAAFGYLLNCVLHECFEQGRDAEKAFRAFLVESGAVERLGLGFNRWYDSQDNFFFGRPDIFSENLKMVWDVKPHSYYGYASGNQQMAWYTIGEYSAGMAAPLFGNQMTITLGGNMNTYEFFYGGNGLVMYRALNPSPLERAFHSRANNLLAPFPSGRQRTRD
jgi:RHS repeat-associated protein